MLDPRYKLLLNITQTVSAEYNILNLIKDCIDEKAKSGSSSGASSPQAQDQQLEQSDEPPSKRFRHLNLLNTINKVGVFVYITKFNYKKCVGGASNNSGSITISNFVRLRILTFFAAEKRY